MKEAEGVRFRVVNLSGESGRKPCNLDILTLQKLCDWIDRHNLTPELAEEVKKAAGRYPHHALEKFQARFENHLAKARRTIKNKQEDKPIEEL